MFYHVSSKKGLTEIEPKVSTHGKPWVYALTDPTIGLVFAGRDDLGFKADDKYRRYGIKNDTPEIYEFYCGCLDEIFKNKDCYVYELEDSGFIKNQTSWSPEWVSPNKTKVIGFRYIADILSEIKKLESEGRFIIHYYEDTPSYNKFVEERINEILNNYCKSGWINISLIRHYEKIVKKFVNENIDYNYEAGFENLSNEKLQNIFQKLDNNKNHGAYVRKELFYFYPNETIDWINKKYQKPQKFQSAK